VGILQSLTHAEFISIFSFLLFSWKPGMKRVEKVLSIHHFRTVQLVYMRVMELMKIWGPVGIGFGSIFVGTLSYLLVKFRKAMEIQIILCFLGFLITFTVISGYYLWLVYSMRQALVQYSASILNRGRPLSRLEKCYYQAWEGYISKHVAFYIL
jgi:hypothetical protein